MSLLQCITSWFNIFLSRLETYEDTTMKRITMNALVDIGCLIMFIPSLVSGLILYFPPVWTEAASQHLISPQQ
jgi:hypothetical protein